MSKKEIEEFCHTDKNLVKKYVNSLLEQTSLKLTNPQRLVIEEMFSRMNEETIMHSMNCVKFADEYIKKYNQSGHSFSKDFEISEQEMLLGMAIHDVGKTKIPKEIIEYPGKYDDEQIKIMNQLSIMNQPKIMLIFQKKDLNQSKEKLLDSIILVKNG